MSVVGLRLVVVLVVVLVHQCRGDFRFMFEGNEWNNLFVFSTVFKYAAKTILDNRIAFEPRKYTIVHLNGANQFEESKEMGEIKKFIMKVDDYFYLIDFGREDADIAVVTLDCTDMPENFYDRDRLYKVTKSANYQFVNLAHAISREAKQAQPFVVTFYDLEAPKGRDLLRKAFGRKKYPEEGVTGLELFNRVANSHGGGIGHDETEIHDRVVFNVDSLADITHMLPFEHLRNALAACSAAESKVQLVKWTMGTKIVKYYRVTSEVPAYKTMPKKWGDMLFGTRVNVELFPDAIDFKSINNFKILYKLYNPFRQVVVYDFDNTNSRRGTVANSRGTIQSSRGAGTTLLGATTAQSVV